MERLDKTLKIKTNSNKLLLGMFFLHLSAVISEHYTSTLKLLETMQLFGFQTRVKSNLCDS